MCPSLQVLSPNPHRVQSAIQSLLSVVTRYAPIWEPFQAGSFVMDLTGTTRLFGIACIVLNIPPIESPANLHEYRE